MRNKMFVPAVAGALLAGLTTSALALNAEGEIAKIDTQANMLQLDDGQTFYVPQALMNHSGLNIRKDVAIRYEVQNGVNVVTGLNEDEFPEGGDDTVGGND